MQVTVDIPEYVLRGAVDEYGQAREQELQSLRRQARILEEKVSRAQSGCRLCGSKAHAGVKWGLPSRGYFLEENFWACAPCCLSAFRLIAKEMGEYGDSNRFFPLADDETKQVLMGIVGRPPAPQLPRRESVEVYWAMGEEDWLVKIGIAACAEERCGQLGLRPLLIEPGGRERERMLHERHGRHRIDPSDLPAWVPDDGKTEWFHRRADVDSYLTLVA